MDIDFKYSGDLITNESLFQIVKEIIQIKNNDEIILKILSIDDIKAETKYGGKTVKLEAKFYNIKKIFGIDVGIGDIVTPEPVNYHFFSTICNENIEVLAYSIETTIAEKFETLISKGVNNSRLKDFFDLYLLNKNGFDEKVLNSALINTFYSRETSFDKNYIKNILDDIFTFERIKQLYENYRKKHSFANEVTFDDCKKAIYCIYNAIKFHEKVLLNNYGIELHIVRHGEDEQDKVGGWSDNHLTENGVRQIYDLKDKIDSHYDIFVSSDLNRALETSNILNEKLNMNMQCSNAFREVNNGKYKNLSKEELVNMHSEYIFSKLEMNQCYPDGESPLLFFKRIEKAFFDLLENNRNKKILLVTHGGVITAIYCLINGLEYSNHLKVIPPTGSLLKLN